MVFMGFFLVRMCSSWMELIVVLNGLSSGLDVVQVIFNGIQILIDCLLDTLIGGGRGPGASILYRHLTAFGRNRNGLLT